MDRSEALKLFDEVKRNIAARDACACHKFPSLEGELSIQYVCENCGARADASYILAYAAGFKAAGGDPNQITPNFDLRG